MSIRIKETGKRRGSKGFVFRIPIAEAGNISEEEITKRLRDVYGTENGRALVEDMPITKYLQRIVAHNKAMDTWSKDESSAGKLVYKAIQEGPIREEVKEGIHLGVFRDMEKKDGDHPFYVSINKNNITFSPAVAMHGMTGHTHSMKRKYNEDWSKVLSYGNCPSVQDTFLNLLEVLEKGYHGEPSKTVDNDNINFKKKKGNRISFVNRPRSGEINRTWATANKYGGITKGDAYSIEFVPNKFGNSLVECTYGKPEDISVVNVLISKDNTPQQREEKMNYYQSEITKRFGVPVRFYLSEHDLKISAKQEYPQAYVHGLENENRIFPKPQSLEQRASSTTAVIAFIGSLFFTTSTLTGNAIGLSNTTSSWIGGILILIGLIALGFWIKSRKNNKKVFVQKISKPVKKKKK